MTLYHVTTRVALPSILKGGLIPSLDKRGKGYENEPPAIYLFNTLADLEDGVVNWLGDCFPEDVELIALEVSLPPEINPVEDPELPGAACRVFKPLAPALLKIVTIVL